MLSTFSYCLLLSVRFLQSRGEEWLLDRLVTQLEIYVGGKKVLFEKLDLHDTDGIATAAKVSYCPLTSKY